LRLKAGDRFGFHPLLVCLVIIWCAAPGPAGFSLLPKPHVSPPQTKAAPSPKTDSLRAQIDIAESLRKAGDFEKAADILTNALAAAAQSTPIPSSALSPDYVEASMKLGLVLWNLGLRPDSQAAYEKALARASAARLSKPEADCRTALSILRLYDEARAHRDNDGDCTKSSASFRSAIDLARSLRSPDFELKCLRQLSVCLLGQNDLVEYKRLNEDALAIARAIRLRKDESMCLDNLGVYYLKTENYAKALACCDEAYEIALKIGYVQGQNEVLTNFGIIYNDIGNYDKALEYLEKALALDEKAFGPAYAAIDLNNIGANHRKRGLLSGNRQDFARALEYYEKAYALIENSKDAKMRIRVLNNLGTVNTDLGRYPEALAKFNLSLKLAEQISDSEALGFILNNVGIVYYALADYETSTKYFQKAVDLGLKVDSGRILWEAFLDLANSTKKLGRTDEALANYRSSIAVIENVRSSLGLEELKASFFGTNKRIEAYYGLIDLLVRLHQASPAAGRDAEAFAVLEKAKARAFLDSFEVAQIAVSRGIDARLTNEENRINGEIAALYKKLLTPDLSPDQKKDIADRLGRSEAEYEKFKREVRAADPAYADLKYPEIITAAEARASLLDDSTAVLAYAVGKDSSFGFALTKGALRVFPLAPRKDLLPKVAAYLRAISDKDGRDFSAGRDLYAELVAPAALPSSVRSLIVVPDDALAYLPFDTLQTPDGKWLIERCAVSYAPSLSSLREIRQRAALRTTPPPKDLLALGDPYYGKNESASGPAAPSQDYFSSGFVFPRLKFSGTEVQRIAALFPPKRTDVFVREQASERTLKRLNLDDYQIIHIAAHGLINDQNPMRSAVVLAQDPDSPDDGFLQMREIYNLRMRADLVVLSACRSGRGQLVRGEGLEGLSRAFFYSGASAVMMSLWEVDDRAGARFMERFYGFLRQGTPIADALRRAKLEMIGGKEAAHPYYWAGMVVSGEAGK
jgi:CHAT domain-containing protein/tetratricopeptide (TPR) repeat protein